MSPESHQLWQDFVSGVLVKNGTLGSLLQSAQLVSITAHELTMEVFYSFHHDQLQQPVVQQVLAEVVKEVFGADLALKVELATVSQDQDQELLSAAETYLV